MLSVHVVHAGNRHLYDEEWEDYLRARHRIYVHEKQWRPESGDGREIDQFDTSHAVYFFGMDQGRLVASARLMPTTQPTLVGDVFPHMCDGAPPSQPDWVEWTKTYVLPEHRSGGRRGALIQLCTAVMEYCVDEGVAAAGGIQELYFLPIWQMLRWKLMPLGAPQEVAGAPAIVAYLECSEEALFSARRVLGFSESLLVRRGAVDHPIVAGIAGRRQ